MAPVNVEYVPVKLLDYIVTVLKSDKFSTVTVALTPNPHTKAEVEKIIYQANMDKSIEITDWLLDQIIGQIFGHHDKRITSVNYEDIQ